MTDGAQLIAGGLESLLQQLRVTASRIAVRIELPADGNLEAEDSPTAPPRRPHSEVQSGTAVLLRMEEVSYGPPPALSAGQAAAEPPPDCLSKVLAFSGLTLDVERLPSQHPSHPASGSTGSLHIGSISASSSRVGPSGASAAGSDSGMSGNGPERAVIFGGDSGAGLAGRLQLQLTAAAAAANTSGATCPRLAASLALQPLRLELHQDHLLLLTDVAASLSAAVAAPSSDTEGGLAAETASSIRCHADNLLVHDDCSYKGIRGIILC